MIEGRIKKIRIWLIVIALLLVIGASGSWVIFSWIYRPALVQIEEESAYIYIPTGSDYLDLFSQLVELNWHKNIKAFDWVAQKKNLPAHIHPGRYKVFQGMSNDSLINLLRSGKQSELMLSYNSMRTFPKLAGIIAKQIEADSLSLINEFTKISTMDSLGFSKEQWFGMFIPNSYRFFWNTDARGFVNRMHKEYLRYWNDGRKKKLESMGMSVEELITLASIIQDETARVSDMPRIAGIYMNRLEKGMRLQACPTVIYALGEPRVKRLLNKHLKVKSPYNTYIHRGLPPGPIRIASLQAIEACINYEKHDYLYFSAKEDFSGATVYAKSYGQHLRNARKYQKALNERNIY